MNSSMSRFLSIIFVCSLTLHAQEYLCKITNRDRLVSSKIDYGHATYENRRGAHKQAVYPNQDRAAVGAFLGKQFFMICDGHGTQGDVVADQVVTLLPEKVLGTKNIKAGFISACGTLQKMFACVSYAKTSGTTMVGGVIERQKLTVGHVGDSRLIVIRQGSVVFATQDHSTKNSEECKRIKQAGGSIINGYVYAKNASSGLAVTRSLGDTQAHDGSVVTETPACAEYELKNGDYIVLASDGYWDVVTNEETAHSVVKMQTSSCDEIAKYLVDKAVDRKSRDDITVLVVRYNQG